MKLYFTIKKFACNHNDLKTLSRPMVSRAHTPQLSTQLPFNLATRTPSPMIWVSLQKPFLISLVPSFLLYVLFRTANASLPLIQLEQVFSKLFYLRKQDNLSDLDKSSLIKVRTVNFMTSLNRFNFRFNFVIRIISNTTTVPD